MFRSLFKKSKPPVEDELMTLPVDVKQKIQDFLTLAMKMDDIGNYNGTTLLKPLYVNWLQDEAQASRCHSQLPMLYLWNEDPIAGSFSLSVNGPLVAGLLEPLLPRKHPQFIEVRDELLMLLRDMSLGAVHSTCKKMGLLPSQAFSGDP